MMKPLLPLLLYLFSRYTEAVSIRQEHSLDLSHWTQDHEADANQLLPVSIALKIQNVDLGVETLLRVSDPTSSDYGKHLSAREVAQMFAPKPSAVSDVMNWLMESGIDQKRIKHSYSGERLSLDLSVQEAKTLLKASFYHQTHRETGQKQIACQHYYIPESITGSVDYILAVAPVSSHRRNFRGHQDLKIRSVEPLDYDSQQVLMNDKFTGSAPLPSECYNRSNIACLRVLYGIPENPIQHPDSSLAVYQPSWHSWLAEDLDAFFKRWQKPLVGSRPKVVSVNGGEVQTNYTGPTWNLEANLDFEYTMSLTAGQEVTDIQVMGNLHDMLEAFDKFYCNSTGPGDDKGPDGWIPSCNTTVCDCGDLSLPKVISISYGWTEAYFTPSYLHRQCTEFLKLGLMGTTVVVSISDHGTTSDGGKFCIDDKMGNATSGRFSPLFPASCPWVTSVGGTQMLKPTDDRSPGDTTLETTFHKNSSGVKLSSGGAFSNVFSTPPYQAPNVAAYQKIEKDHLDNFRDRFDSTGRGYPDVAVRADNYPIVSNGVSSIVSGTSASNPVFASIITLINSERMHAGKGSVGFINPALYSNPQALNDITTGSNEGCGIDEAFRAAPGWDAVTGLGSPDYERLRSLFMALP